MGGGGVEGLWNVGAVKGKMNRIHRSRSDYSRRRAQLGQNSAGFWKKGLDIFQ